MGVSNFITFDAHDPRVQNSIPLNGFDNFFPTYQFLNEQYISQTSSASIWVCSTNAAITPLL